MTSPKVLDGHYCKKLSFCIYRLVFQTFLSVILEPSCKVIKEMLFRIVLSSADHLSSRSAYIFYENPWMFVPSPQCIAIPYTLCIWIFPPLASRFCFSRLYSSFLSVLYSVSVGSYTLFLSALTLFLSPNLLGFPTLQPISLYGNAPFVLHLEKCHPSFVLPLSPHPFRSPFPVSRCAPFFFVSCQTYSTVPFHPASSPVLPCHTSSLTVFSYPSLSSVAG